MGRYTEAQKEATLKYHKRTRIQKPVEFNRENPDDMELVEWIQQQGNWQAYIKDLIRKDMKERS